ncbi:hypothetical protein B0H16DRAFT_1725234 [Mycena metata]|uniref:Uncharacterized protein n=1 Tax=Mycena metata TaxID=1033252 RepID=A0AAD7IRX2_9AGAR|nr:hypothetical protein B0H16DRAFT_1725234 [Mycena metata]
MVRNFAVLCIGMLNSFQIITFAGRGCTPTGRRPGTLNDDPFAATTEDEELAWQADLSSAAHIDLAKHQQIQGVESDFGLVVQQLSENAIHGATKTPFGALQFIHQVDASSATPNSKVIKFHHEDYSLSRKQLSEPKREMFTLGEISNEIS